MRTPLLNFIASACVVTASLQGFADEAVEGLRTKVSALRGAAADGSANVEQFLGLRPLTNSVVRGFRAQNPTGESEALREALELVEIYTRKRQQANPLTGDELAQIKKFMIDLRIARNLLNSADGATGNTRIATTSTRPEAKTRDQNWFDAIASKLDVSPIPAVGAEGSTAASQGSGAASTTTNSNEGSSGTSTPPLIAGSTGQAQSSVKPCPLMRPSGLSRYGSGSCTGNWLPVVRARATRML